MHSALSVLLVLPVLKGEVSRDALHCFTEHGGGEGREDVHDGERQHGHEPPSLLVQQWQQHLQQSPVLHARAHT